MADAKVYRLGTLTLADVARELEDYLRFQKNMETEGVAQAENIYFIQARTKPTAGKSLPGWTRPSRSSSPHTRTI